MQFAVIGDSAEAVFLLRMIDASAAHSLTMCCVDQSLAATMAACGLTFDLVESPEEAIVGSQTDAVVVACSDVDESIANCRQASQTGRHVVVIPPHGVSTAFSYELHLLLDESEHGIVPFFGRWYVDDAVSGNLPTTDVRQLSLHAPMIHNERDLRRAQLHAVDVLSGCGYQFSRITGLDVPGADGTLLSRSITLAASDSSDVKMPPAVVLFGANGATGDTWRITVAKTDGSSAAHAAVTPGQTDGSEAVGGLATVEVLCANLENSDRCQRRMEDFSNTLELMTGLEKSFRRRRTVDVYFDGVSERSAFKTQMTAIGCGVMGYVTFGLIALAFFQAVGAPAGLLKVGMVLWIAPVVLFLLAQLLLPLARERRRNDVADDRREADTADTA